MKKAIIVSFFLFFLVSCNKNKTTPIKAFKYVTTTYDGKPAVKIIGIKDPTKYTNIQIPNKINKLPVVRVEGMDKNSLISIIIPNNVKSLSLDGCENLTNIVFPTNGNLETIDFSSCSNLKSIVIPRSVKVISNSAFNNCQKLESIIIPDSVETIGAAAFRDCQKLNSIVIPDSVECIGALAFMGCKSLSSVNLPYKIKRIEEGTFAGCSSLISVKSLSSIDVIAKEAFIGCNNLKSIQIPLGENPTKLQDRVFSGCSSLEDFNIYWEPDEVEFYVDRSTQTRFPVSVFNSCSLLKSILYPVSINKIRSKRSKGALSFNRFIERYNAAKIFDGYNGKLIIEEGITAIGVEELRGLKNVTIIKLPSTLQEICNGAFVDCDSLKFINIPESVRSIGANAFANCKNCILTFEDGRTRIGGCGMHCFDVLSINIPSTVSEIEAGAFAYCSISNIVIPSSVKKIESRSDGFSRRSAFEGFRGNVVFENGITKIPEYSLHNSSVRGVEIPQGVEEIGDCAFDFKCKNDITINLPVSLKKIGYHAFCNDERLNLNYDGTMNQWEQIEKNAIFGIYHIKVHCIDGDT